MGQHEICPAERSHADSWAPSGDHKYCDGIKKDSAPSSAVFPQRPVYCRRSRASPPVTRQRNVVHPPRQGSAFAAARVTRTCCTAAEPQLQQGRSEVLTSLVTIYIIWAIVAFLRNAIRGLRATSSPPQSVAGLDWVDVGKRSFWMAARARARTWLRILGFLFLIAGLEDHGQLAVSASWAAAAAAALITASLIRPAGRMVSGTGRGASAVSAVRRGPHAHT